MESELVIIIDADPIVHMAAATAQTVTYSVLFEDEEGEVHEALWTDGHAKNGFFRDHPELTVIEQSKHVDPEPVQNALHTCKHMTNHILEECCRAYGAKSAKVYLLLSGPHNFRHELAADYKGERKDKPHWYQQCRNYMVEQLDADVIYGWEADDECSIIARACRKKGVQYVVCSIDKDLDQIPGDHYDYRKKEFYEVSPANATKLLWQQILSGDSGDNIPGIYGIGSVKARNIVDTAVNELGPEYNPEWFLWREALELCEKSIDSHPDKYPEWAIESPWEYMVLMARMVYLLHEPNELWTAPGLPKEYIFTDEDNDEE